MEYFCNNCSQIRRIVKLFGSEKILELLSNQLFKDKSSEIKPDIVKDKPQKEFVVKSYPFLSELEAKLKENPVRDDQVD